MWNELAVHTLTHPRLTECSDMEVMLELANEFIALEPDEPKLFYIWGHSYEFDMDKWIMQRHHVVMSFVFQQKNTDANTQTQYTNIQY